MSLYDDLARLAQAKTESESEGEIDRIKAETDSYWDKAAADFLWKGIGFGDKGEWPTLDEDWFTTTLESEK